MLNGICIYASEIKGGELFIRNCQLFTRSDPSAVFRGIIDVGGNSSAITSSADETLSLIVENNYVYADALAAGTSFMTVVNSGSSAFVNIYIDGLRADVNAMGGVLRTRLDSGIANSQAIVVDNISNFPSGTNLHVAQGGAYLNKPQRLMRQTGTSSLTASSGTDSAVSPIQMLRYVYPRRPQCSATAASSTALVYNGNRTVLAGVYLNDTDRIRTFIATGDGVNWNATATTNVDWQVGIDEI